MKNWWNLLGAAACAFTMVITTSITFMGIAAALLVLNLGYFLVANIKGENI